VLLLEYLQKIGFEEESFVVDLKNLKVYKGKLHYPLMWLSLPHDALWLEKRMV